MANMGYCRFENTLYALGECLNHIEECKETSSREIDGIKKYEDDGYVYFE